MRKFLIAFVIALTLFSSRPALPITHATDVLIQSQGNPNVRVWVNTKSGVYHCPGTRWYGNTKEGEYMTQKQAQASGYRPAYGSVCG
jgi:hypothetical protein